MANISRLRGLGLPGLGLSPTLDAGVGVPQWVRDLNANAIAAWDFAHSRYWAGSDKTLAQVTSYTRAGSALADNLAVVYSSFGANVARITDRGILLEPSVQNKCTNPNANPVNTADILKSGDAASILSVVDDTAALAAAGLGSICTSGKVYKLDNSAGVGVAQASVAGSPGNTSNHTCTAFIRGGTGRIQEDWNGNGANFAASASYVRRSSGSVVPGNSAAKLGIRANAGQVIYFVLNQLEQAVTPSSPIVTSGSAVTRADDALTLKDQASGVSYGVSFTFDDGSTQTITGLSGDYAVPTTLNRRLVKQAVAFFP